MGGAFSGGLKKNPIHNPQRKIRNLVCVDFKFGPGLLNIDECVGRRQPAHSKNETSDIQLSVALSHRPLQCIFISPSQPTFYLWFWGMNYVALHRI